MIKLLIPAIGAYLLSTPKTALANSALSIKGVIEVKHIIYNRVRVSVPLLKNDQEKIDTLLGELNKLNVVFSAEASPITGSLTIAFDQTQIEPVLLLGIVVKLLGIDLELSIPKEGKIEKEYTSLTEAFDQSIMQVTGGKLDTKSAITTAIVGGILYQTVKNGASFKMLPTPITLVWWLYQNNLINKGKQ